MTAISRRSVTRGIAWAVPTAAVSFAAPALAVSNPAYIERWWTDGHYASRYSYCQADSSSIGNLLVAAGSSSPPGFAVTYEAGKGDRVKVTVSNLKMFFAVPWHRLQTTYTVGSKYAGWIFTGVTSNTSVTLRDGSRVSYVDLYTFTHADPIVGYTSPYNSPASLPGSTFSATGSGYWANYSSGCDSEYRVYGGYTGTFETADGVKRTFNTIIPGTMRSDV